MWHSNGYSAIKMATIETGIFIYGERNCFSDVSRSLGEWRYIAKARSIFNTTLWKISSKFEKSTFFYPKKRFGTNFILFETTNRENPLQFICIALNSGLRPIRLICSNRKFANRTSLTFQQNKTINIVFYLRK